MLIKVENFGPIKKGKIELKPLNVFIGKNNYGKSYIATLIYSIYLNKSKLKIRITPEQFNKIIKISKDLKEGNHEENMVTMLKTLLLSELLGLTIDLTSKEILISQIWEKVIDLNKIYELFITRKQKSFEFELLSEDIKKILTEILEKLYSSDFINTVEYSFSNKIKNLIRLNRRISKIKIQTNKCFIEIMLKNSKQNTRCVKVRIANLDAPKVKIIIEQNLGRTLTEQHDDTIIIRLPDPFGLCISLTISLLEYLELPSIPDVCYYLPASRSGMMIGFDAFISGVIERMATGRAPKMPGVILDFLNEIKNISPETKSIFYDLGLKLEKEIGWTVSIKKKKQDLFDITDIAYTKKGEKRKYKREHISAGILEMSPFILYLKHVMLPNSTLIVEEPEAHIHPNLQRIFIKYLVKLVRSNANIKVIIITHSDYILEQINTMISLGNLNEEHRKLFAEKRGYDPEDYLTTNEVSAYLFKLDEDGDGCIIEELEIDEDGILEDDFFKVREELYEEILAIKKIKEGYI